MTILITDDNTPKVTVTGLGENRKYSFRVKAVNAAGASEPSDPTDEITCKLRKLRPVILKDSVKDVKVPTRPRISKALLTLKNDNFHI